MKPSNPRWRRASVAAILFVVVAVLVLRYVFSSHAKTPARPRPVAAAGQLGHAMPRGERVQALADKGSAQRALDLDALRRSLAGRSDGEAERERIVAFARFRDGLAAYGRERAAMSESERAQRARALLAELPQHVARKEIVPVQAEAVSVALLTDAEPDPVVRDEAIAQMRRQWDSYARASVGPSPASDPRFQAYLRESRRIVEQVQAGTAEPAAQQAAIAQQLLALRVQLFDTAAAAVRSPAP